MLEDGISDQEFIAGLRAAIERYLGAVDQWEAAYQKYYRLPGDAARINGDLEAEQRAYRERRRELEQMLPRARRLCLKHRLRDPFRGLLRISLGRYAPQHRVDSAIGRSERNEVTKCLVELSGTCQEWEPTSTSTSAVAEPESDRGSLLRRLVNYFY
ncbi:MAG: hypothetical protein LAQ69_07715 [Acidobacteriia bacterium]|nr:hypothetical protein [Terriglobia bacterium]